MFKKPVPEGYDTEHIVSLYRDKHLTPEQIAKLFNLDHNVVKRILLDEGFKLEKIDELVGTVDDYKVKRSNKRLAVTVVAMVFIAMFIGMISYSQQGSLLGKSRITGAVIYEENLAPCLYECCNDIYHKTKDCPEGMICSDYHCYAAGEDIDGEV